MVVLIMINSIIIINPQTIYNSGGETKWTDTDPQYAHI